MIKILTDKEKILKYLNYKGLSKNEFYKKTGLSVGFLDSGNSLGVDKLRRIIDIYHDFNPGWLLNDSGEMLKSEYPKAVLTNKNTGIPLVSKEAFAGIGNFNTVIEENEIQDHYVVPDFGNVDFLIKVSGSSMYPKYNSGDIVACRILNDPSFIQWNKIHLIVTDEQGIMVKRLKKGHNDDHWLCVSDNESYLPFEIPKKEVTGIALVIGVIRLE